MNDECQKQLLMSSISNLGGRESLEIVVSRAETPGGVWGGDTPPPNLEKARLVGQTTANCRANFCK